jgi:hypothetical protein
MESVTPPPVNRSASRRDEDGFATFERLAEELLGPKEPIIDLAAGFLIGITRFSELLDAILDRLPADMPKRNLTAVLIALRALARCMDAMNDLRRERDPEGRSSPPNAVARPDFDRRFLNAVGAIEAAVRGRSARADTRSPRHVPQRPRAPRRRRAATSTSLGGTDPPSPPPDVAPPAHGGHFGVPEERAA